MERVRASHILVENLDQAKEIHTQLINGGNFEMLARTHSKCPSGNQGGDLGEFMRGQMVKPFEDVAFDLDVNQVSKPVQTQFGFHVIHRTG
jgi:peptidyl-prolyl cis-trans isomerase C